MSAIPKRGKKPQNARNGPVPYVLFVVASLFCVTALAQDPGRVTARRLNRAEYSNTIRDLLGIDFHAEKYFPTDDSGDGFDNIGEVLTVSPVLMEKYLSAAERIARWAISTELPSNPIAEEYHIRDRKIRRVDPSTIEALHRVEFAGDYTVRFGLPGERAPDGKPVTLNLWMDGKLLASKSIETRPSGLVYFNPYSEEELKVYLPEGDHVFRAGFSNDEFVKTVAQPDLYNDKKNKFLNSILFIGPFPSTVQKASRKRILICNPDSGRACIDKILSTLARRAYRRPVTPQETATLVKFVEIATRDGQSTEQGLELAIEAMLVSPKFLFRIEHDAKLGRSVAGASDFANRAGVTAELFSLELDAGRPTPGACRIRQTPGHQHAASRNRAHARRRALVGAGFEFCRPVARNA
jgi:hypothetical protein